MYAEKTDAITKMGPPTSVPKLLRFMRMVNQLGKFTPNLAKLTQSLPELLSKSRTVVLFQHNCNTTTVTAQGRSIYTEQGHAKYRT